MTALNEDQAIAALQRVQGLNPEQFQAALERDLGQPMLAVFHALARAMHPADSDDAIAQKIHLMMLAYLMARSPA